jgi:hypothetical protein
VNDSTVLNKNGKMCANRVHKIFIDYYETKFHTISLIWLRAQKCI